MKKLVIALVGTFLASGCVIGGGPAEEDPGRNEAAISGDTQGGDVVRFDPVTVEGNPDPYPWNERGFSESGNKKPGWDRREPSQTSH